MSHRDALPKTAEHLRMEAFYTSLLAKQGTTVGWGFDKNSQYLSSYARDAWAAWQEAQSMGMRYEGRTKLTPDSEWGLWQTVNRHVYNMWKSGKEPLAQVRIVHVSVDGLTVIVEPFEQAHVDVMDVAKAMIDVVHDDKIKHLRNLVSRSINVLQAVNIALQEDDHDEAKRLVAEALSEDH